MTSSYMHPHTTGSSRRRGPARRLLTTLALLAASTVAPASDNVAPEWLTAAAGEPMLMLGSKLASHSDVRAALYTESRLQTTLSGILFEAGIRAVDKATDRAQPRVVDADRALSGTRS